MELDKMVRARRAVEEFAAWVYRTHGLVRKGKKLRVQIDIVRDQDTAPVFDATGLSEEEIYAEILERIREGWKSLTRFAEDHGLDGDIFRYYFREKCIPEYVAEMVQKATTIAPKAAGFRFITKRRLKKTKRPSA